MTRLQPHRRSLYRVYSEDEFLKLLEGEPAVEPGPEAAASQPPERHVRRAAGAAVTSASLRWAAPVTGVTLLTGALGAGTALVTSINDGHRIVARPARGASVDAGTAGALRRTADAGASTRGRRRGNRGRITRPPAVAASAGRQVPRSHANADAGGAGLAQAAAMPYLPATARLDVPRAASAATADGESSPRADFSFER